MPQSPETTWLGWRKGLGSEVNQLQQAMRVRTEGDCWETCKATLPASHTIASQQGYMYVDEACKDHPTAVAPEYSSHSHHIYNLRPLPSPTTSTLPFQLQPETHLPTAFDLCTKSHSHLPACVSLARNFAPQLPLAQLAIQSHRRARIITTSTELQPCATFA